MPDWTQVNWLAIVIAAVVGLVIGAVWYLPAVFGRRWAAAAGVPLPLMSEIAPTTYVANIIQALLSAYVLALIVGGHGLGEGIVWGATLWVGFVATIAYYSVLFEKRSLEYWLFGAGFWLVDMVVMGAILGYFSATM